ncbi:PKD domain-containing protein [Marinoscillum furvescens]|uniref:Putative secreted protein (Por secretion system target) n=1 Tax=Marinoscillum furvescens DSM 4134 TaxID=1122208 RepID=A0A3D9L4J7_MARFU|nr:PKD domain-containing protein [Marinoscillum furvescens]REE00533.1 putative secreted protein (Por secretion system target) [Marinoscillum furvescens DSM 4134]
MSARLIILIALFWSMKHYCFGQTDFYSKNTEVSISGSGLLYVSGNLKDASNSAETEKYKMAGGTLRVDGDLINEGNTIFIAKVDVDSDTTGYGSVIFGGGGVDTIKSPQATLYLPNLTLINNTKVYLDNSLDVRIGVDVSGGDLVLRNNAKITFPNNSTLTGESQNISGNGVLHFEEFSLAKGEYADNYEGSGIGFSSTGLGITITRTHSDSPPDNVANGTSMKRYFDVSMAGSHETYLSDFRINYSPGELNGLTAADLAIYLSEDGGSKWVKQPSTPNATGNYVEAAITFKPSTSHRLVLADAECDTKPDARPAVAGGQLNTSENKIVICEGNDLNLSSSGADYVYWVLESDTTFGDSFSINDIGTTLDNKPITLFERMNTGCENSADYTLNVIDLPVAAFTFSPGNTLSCYGDAVSFDGTSSTSDSRTTVASYAWNFDDLDNTSSDSNPNYVFSESGYFDVDLQVTDAYGCVSPVTTRLVQVHNLPEVSFTFPSRECEGLPVDFTNNSTYVPIDGTTADPEAVLSMDWTFGDGNSSSEFSPQHTYDIHGNLSIKLIATHKDHQCRDSITQTIEINPKPEVVFKPQDAGGVDLSLPYQVCEGVVIKFNNESSIAHDEALGGKDNLHYTWDFGDHAKPELKGEESPSRSYKVSQLENYTVELLAESENKGCKDSVAINLKIFPAPEGMFTKQVGGNEVDGVCEGVNVAFANNSTVPGGRGFSSFKWYFGDGNSSTASNPTYTYSQSSGYTVSLLRETNDGCIDSTSQSFEVYDFPVADFYMADVCDGTEVIFNAADQSHLTEEVTYNWSLGDGNSKEGQNTSHIYDTHNSYTVELTVTSDHGCSDSGSDVVQIHQTPNLTLPTYALSCEGNLTLDAVDEAGDFPNMSNGSFTWTNAQGDVLSTTDELQVTEYGEYSLEVETNDGCSAAYTIPVYLVEPTDLGTSITSCDFARLDATPDSYPSGVGELSYQWKKDGITIGGATHAIYEASSSGTYTVEVTYALPELVGAPECTHVQSVAVTIDTPPALELGDDVTICAGGSATLESNITASSYEWKNSAGSVVGNRKQLLVNSADTYRLTVASGTCSFSDEVTVEQISSPVAAFNASSPRVCLTEAFSFANLSSAASGDPLTDFLWDFGDGTTSTERQPDKTYLAAGSYDVSLTVSSELGCSDVYTDQLVVDPLPGVAFSVANGCEGEEINFVNNSTIAGGGGMTYEWRFSDGRSSRAESPALKFFTAGTYTATLLATSEYGCTSSMTESFEVLPKPSGGFEIQDALNAKIFEVCSGETFYIKNTSSDPDGGSLTYAWDFGDGHTADSFEPSHAYSTPGIYTISLIQSTGSGCSRTVSRQLKVNSLPSVAFTVADACQNIGVDFQNQSSIAAGSISDYLWDFGDGESSSEQSPEHSYTTWGDHTVSLIATSGKGCVDSTSQVIEIFRAPAFDLGDYVIAVNGYHDMVPKSDPSSYLPAGSSYQWTYEQSGFTSEDDSVRVTRSGFYEVEVISPEPQSCRTSSTLPVYILEPNDLGSNRSVCEQTILDARPLAFPAQSSEVSYRWKKDNVDLGHSNSQLEVTESGWYTAEVTFTVTDLIGSPSRTYTDSVQILVEAPPVLDLGPDRELCSNAELTLSSNVTADSYQWKNLTTGQTLGASSNQLVTEAGTYQLEVVKGECAVRTTVEVNTVAPPSAGYTVDRAHVCEGETVTFTNVSYSNGSDAIASYSWDFGDGTTSVENSPVKLFEADGEYQVTLQVSSTKGCVSTFSQTITVGEPPVVDFSVGDACAGAEVSFTNESSGYSSEASFSWSFGDGNTSFVASPVHQFEEAGSYQVTLEITDGQCVQAATKMLNVLAQPSVDLGDEIITCGSEVEIDGGAAMDSYRWYDVASGSTLATSRYYTETVNRTLGLEVTNSSGCTKIEETEVTLNTPVTIDLGADRQICDSDILDAGVFPGVAYQWSTGDTTRFLEVTTSGSYTVSVTDQNGCTATDGVNLTVVASPVVDLGGDLTICFGESVTIDAGNTGADHLWSTGASTQTITVFDAGIYKVEVSNGGCMVSDSVEIRVLDKPKGSFTLSGTCEGSAINFEAEEFNAEWEYLWDFGDGTQGVGFSPSKSFTAAGAYTVELTVTNADGCKASTAKEITIEPVPVADFSFSTACEGSEVSFTNNTTISGGADLTYSWDFGDGAVSTSASPAHLYTTSGSYTVRLQVSSASCDVTTTKTIAVHSVPIIEFEDTVYSCSEVARLDAGNSGHSYLWSNNHTTQVLEVSKPGSFWVEVRDSQGCVSRDTAVVVFLENPKPDLGPDVEACGEITMGAGINAVSYNWSSGGSSKTIVTNESGTYWVETISKDLCVNRDTVAVDVFAVPDFSLGADRVACDGEEVQLEGITSTAGVSYLWNTGATTNSLVVNSKGTYWLEATTNEGCNYRDSVEVHFNPLPDLPLDTAYEGCDMVVLDAQNPESTYLWSDGSISATLTVERGGDYWVQVTTEEGCQHIDSTSVTIRSTPVVDLGEDISLCPGGVAQLDAGNTGASYLWSNGHTGQKLEVSDNGRYKVTVSYGACTQSDSVEVEVLDSPDATFSFYGSCAGAEISFVPDSLNESIDYLWDFGDGTQDVRRIPEKTYSTAGSYSVSLTATDPNGCSATSMQLVTIEPVPTPNFSFTNGCEGQSIQFENMTSYAGTDSLSYRWIFGDGSTSDETNPFHSFKEAGSYTVRLTAYSESCSSFSAKTVTIREAPRIDLAEEVESCKDVVTLNAGDEGDSYLWSNNSTAQHLEVKSSGSYWVEVSNSSGCSARDTTEVTLLRNPKPDLGADTEACGEFLLDPGVDAASYKWSNGSTTAKITATTTATYWVEVISEDLCVSRDTIGLVIHEVPEFSLGPDQIHCAGEPVELTGHPSADVIHYKWNTGASESEVTVTSTGDYWMEAITEEGCSYTDSIHVHFNPLPEDPLQNEYNGCDWVVLDALNPGSSYLWSNGSTNSKLTTDEDGVYWVKITTQDGCELTDTTRVTINNSPQPDLGEDVTLCHGEQITLDAGVFNSYHWNELPGSRYLDVGTSGEYVLMVTNEFGCEGYDTVKVTVRPAIGLELGDDRKICDEATFSLDAGVESVSYEWKSDNGFEASSRVITDLEPGMYWVTVTDEFGCTETDVVNIESTSERIAASFLMPSTIGVNEKVHMVQLTEPVPASFRWDFGDGRYSSNMVNPSIYYFTPGEYTVSLEVSNGICTDTQSKTLTVVDARSIDVGDPKIPFLEFRQLAIYPNPAQDEITFDFELSSAARMEFRVFDFSGTEILHYGFLDASGQVEIDIADLASGTYIVTVQAGSQVEKMRFVKVK